VEVWGQHLRSIACSIDGADLWTVYSRLISSPSSQRGNSQRWKDGLSEDLDEAVALDLLRTISMSPFRVTDCRSIKSHHDAK
jgi:hypothetical protein